MAGSKKNGLSKKGSADNKSGKKKGKGKKKKSKSKVHEFTPSETSLIMTYLLVYSKAKSLAFFKKTYKDLKLEVKKETLSLNSENKQNYEYVRALQEINDQLLTEITDNNLSKKLPLYMNMDEAFTTSQTALNTDSNDVKNDNGRHKKKIKAKETVTEKTIKNTYKYKYEEQIRNLDEQIQEQIERIIKARKYAKQLDEENEKLDNELATIKSNLNNPLDEKVKELNEIYNKLIEKNKEEIKNLYETNNKKAAVSKRFAEESMCNIEDGANLMQFESLSYKNRDIYLKNRYLHQKYSMILEYIQQLHYTNENLSKENNILINRCIDIDYNGRYLNYNENRLKGNFDNINNSSTQNKKEIKKINYEKVSSTLECIISGKSIENIEGSNNQDNNEDENKQISKEILNEFKKVKKQMGEEEFQLNKDNNNNNISNDEHIDEINLSTEEILEQTKLEYENNNKYDNINNNCITNTDNNNNNIKNNIDDVENDINNDDNIDDVENDINNNDNIDDIEKNINNNENEDDNLNNNKIDSNNVNINNSCNYESKTCLNDESSINNIENNIDHKNSNDINDGFVKINYEDEEEFVKKLIKIDEMKKREYEINPSVPENKIDNIIYSKYHLKHYNYISPEDIHKSLNLSGDDESMCTRLVKLTNYNLNNLESYKSKMDKNDLYLIVKDILRKVDEIYQKESEIIKQKPKWKIKKPDDPKQTFLIEKNEKNNSNQNKKIYNSYYDFIDVNDITKIEDVNRMTELKIASYDYFKKFNDDVIKKKEKVNHNIPNLRLYNRHYGQLVDIRKIDDKKEETSTKKNNKKNYRNEYSEYVKKIMENEKEIERIQLENKRRHRSQMYSTIPIQHPSLSISEKAIIQYNKRKEFNDADIQRLLHYKVIKNTNIKQSLYDINHINNINDIIEKKGNKNDILLNSYSDLFTEKKRILDDKDISLYDNNGKYKTILNLEIDPYKKYCDLNPIIEYEINKALNDKSMKNGNFFWYKSEKKPIERIDIMTNEMSGSFIPHLMKGSKLTKPTSSYNNNGIDNLPNINDKTT